MENFQRARQPDQVQLRRQALLKAAAEMFDDEGPAGVGLNALAARAGFTKSNVYRYFESREHVLLALFLQEYEELARRIADLLTQGPERSASYAARTIAEAFIARPRCCRLMTIFSGVLERNVSETVVENVKRTLVQYNVPVFAGLGEQLPNATAEGRGWALSMILSLVAGMWPAVDPSPAASAVLAKPEFSHMRLQPRHDLTKAVHALLVEIATGETTPVLS